jgi:hypothetical protein
LENLHGTGGFHALSTICAPVVNLKLSGYEKNIKAPHFKQFGFDRC